MVVMREQAVVTWALALGLIACGGGAGDRRDGAVARDGRLSRDGRGGRDGAGSTLQDARRLGDTAPLRDRGSVALRDSGRLPRDAGSNPVPRDAQPAPADGAAPQEPAGLEGTVAAHNAARAEVGVGPLRWDPSLAAIAEAWVRQCRDVLDPRGLVDHNAGRSVGYPTSVGENIYGSMGTASGVSAVARWVGEKVNYHHDTNSCESSCGPGGNQPCVCGHYTQVVWRNTTRVGCARHSCPGLTYGNTVVCNYAPAGNVSGQSPY